MRAAPGAGGEGLPLLARQAEGPAAPVRGLVLEDGEGGLKVLLGRLLGITQAEAARELDQLLPAHLAWAWDTAVTWVALDAYPRSFEAWDDLGLTWAQLDGVSRQDLETVPRPAGDGAHLHRHGQRGRQCDAALFPQEDNGVRPGEAPRGSPGRRRLGRVLPGVAPGGGNFLRHGRHLPGGGHLGGPVQ